MTAGRIRVELELDDKDFTVRMVRAGQASKTFARELDETNRSLRRIDRGVNGLLPRLRDLFVTVSIAKGGIRNMYGALAGWQARLISTNAEIERMTFLLRGMSSEVTQLGKEMEAQRDLDFLFNLAETTPYNLNELTNSFVKFRSVGLDPTDGSLQSLTDALASFGGNSASLHRATIAIQQMAGKGVISMEELRQQLGEHVPNAIRLMARGMSMTYEELVDKISKGMVESQSALARMFAEFDRTLGGSAERMMGTWSGLMSVLETRWTKFQIALGAQGYFDKAKKMLQQLVDVMDERTIAYYGQMLGKVLASMADAIERTAKFIYTWRSEIMQAAKAIAILVTVIKAAQLAKLAYAGVMRLLAGQIIPSVNAQLALAAKSTGTLTVATKAQAVAFGTMVGSARAASVALGAMGGPIGLLVTGLALGAAAFFGFSDKAKDAAADLRNFGMVLNEEAVRLNEQHAENLRTRMSQIRQQMLDEEIAGGGTGSRYHERLKQQLAAVEREYEEHNERLGRAKEDLRENNIAKDIELYLRDINRTVDGYRSAYESDLAFFEEAFKAGLIDQEQFKLEQIRATNELFDSRIALYEEKMAETQAAIDAAAEGEKTALWRRYGEVREIRNQIIQDQIRQIAMIREGATIVKGITDGNDGNNKLQTFKNNLGANLESAKADFAGLNGEVEKFMFLLREGHFGEAGAELWKDEEEIERIKAMIRELGEVRERLKQANQERTAAANAEKRIAEMTERSTDALAALRASLDSSGRSTEKGEINMLRRELDKLVAALPEARRESEEMKQVINSLLYEAEASQSLKFADDLREKTRQLQLGLMMERDAKETSYHLAVEEAVRKANLQALAGDDFIRVQKELNDYLLVLANQHARDMEHPIQTLARSWEDATSRMQQASAKWLDDASNRLTKFVMTGKLDFGDFAMSVIEDIVKIRMQEAMSKIISGINFGGGGEGGGILGSLFKFANGGIMTGSGSMPLRAYSKGGIADRPQLALFGEGRMPEAYVPLPDGRTIPVTMTGGAGGGAGNVQVNVINQTGQQVEADHGTPRFDGEQMVLDVVLRAVSRPGAFRDTMKGAIG